MDMNKIVRKKIIAILVLISVLLAGYGSFRLYNYIVADITRRVKEGVSKGIVDTLNPLKWPGKIFGRKKDR
jgi:hypothetical protein